MNRPASTALKPPLREGFQPDEPAQPVDIQTSAPAPVGERWPLVVKLKYKGIVDPSKPDEIRELRLRQPTALDIEMAGAPVQIGASGIFTIDERKMGAMIGRLSGILTPLLQQMDSRDWYTAAFRLYRFFLPTWEED
jgi:hypothetical protein